MVCRKQGMPLVHLQIADIAHVAIPFPCLLLECLQILSMVKDLNRGFVDPLAFATTNGEVGFLLGDVADKSPILIQNTDLFTHLSNRIRLRPNLPSWRPHHPR